MNHNRTIMHVCTAHKRVVVPIHQAEYVPLEVTRYLGFGFRYLGPGKCVKCGRSCGVYEVEKTTALVSKPKESI